MFKRLFLSFALFASFAVNSSAQNFTLQGGNFQVAGVPVANGSVVLTLSNPSATICVGGGASTPSYTINLDANGNMPLTTVLGNSALCPQGTFYTAQLFTGASGGGSLISTSTWIVGPSAPYSGTLYPNVMVLPAVSFTGGVTVPSATVAFSATPTFNAATVSKFYITLTGNVTSSTLTGSVKDQLVIFVISQDGVGGRTFAWPTNVKGQSIATGVGLTSTQAFTSDGTNFWPIGPMTVSSGTTDVRGNSGTFTGNVSVGGTLGVTGVSSTANVIVNPSSTGTGAALTVGGTSSTTGGMSIFVGAQGSATERAAIVPADGSSAAVRVGSLSVRAVSGGFLTGAENASISSAGAIVGTSAVIAGVPVVTTTATQALTGKTLTSPTVTNPTTTGTDSGTETLGGKTLTAPTLTGTAPYNRLRANQGTALVTGDVGSLSNFGTTASVAAVSGTDSAGTISILSNGTGQVANGGFNLTFHDGTWTTSPVCVANRAEGNGPNAAPVGTAASATTLSFIFSGTAAAGVTYTVNFICMGK